MRFVIAATCALSLLLAGCGGDSDADGETADAEQVETATVSVTLVDSLPVEVLWNHDDKQCRSTNIIAADMQSTTPRTITLRDAEGRIAGTAELPEVGGEWHLNEGCRWDVEIDVDRSDFYEVTVDSPEGESTATGELEGD